jgi:hypothetical protein
LPNKNKIINNEEYGVSLEDVLKNILFNLSD